MDELTADQIHELVTENDGPVAVTLFALFVGRAGFKAKCASCGGDFLENEESHPVSTITPDGYVIRMMCMECAQIDDPHEHRLRQWLERLTADTC